MGIYEARLGNQENEKRMEDRSSGLSGRDDGEGCRDNMSHARAVGGRLCERTGVSGCGEEETGRDYISGAYTKDWYMTRVNGEPRVHQSAMPGGKLLPL